MEWLDYLKKQVGAQQYATFECWCFGRIMGPDATHHDYVRAWNIWHPNKPVSLADKKTENAKKWVKLWKQKGPLE